MTRFRTRRALLFYCSTLLFSSMACSSEEGALGGCDDGICDEDMSVHDKLSGLNDPIAKLLRDQYKIMDTQDVAADSPLGMDYFAGEDGVLEISYDDLVTKMATFRQDASGNSCGESSIKTFIISDFLFGADAGQFPRFVSVVCAQDNSLAGEFFINTVSEVTEEQVVFDDEGDPLLDENGDEWTEIVRTGEIDDRDLEFFAWDPELNQFNFYATSPHPNDDKHAILQVQPARCRQCHLTPSDTDPVGMPMTPVMNELNRPWTHWKANPGFENHGFDVAQRIKDGNFYENVGKWTEQARAADLEQIMVGAFNRVSTARMAARRTKVGDHAEAVEAAMGLLRPLFCAEQLNYLSEQGEGGEIFNGAVLDSGLSDLYRRLGVQQGNWAWFHNDSFVVQDTGDEGIVQLPIRGAADIEAQKSLIATRVVTIEQALQARAIDWHNPAMSETRCDLWRDALARYRAEVPEVSDERRVLNVARKLLPDVLSVAGPDGRLPLVVEGKILSVESSEPGVFAAISERIARDTLADADCDADGYCVVDATELGNRFQNFFSRINGQEDARAQLGELRRQRICHLKEEVETTQQRFESLMREDDGVAVTTRFMNEPHLPSVDCE